MRARIFCRVWLALLAMTASAVAFGQVSKPGTGTVTGHVFCGDTQKPARFAQVLLYQVPSAVTPMPNMQAMDAKAQQAAFTAVMDAQSSATLVQAQTGIDGGFVATDVPPGDYYAMAAVPGYVQPRNLVQAAYDNGEDLTKGITGVAVVHVSADRSATAEITVTRGAAVEGRVQWDDGGPVNGAIVTVEPTAKEHKQLPPQFGMISAGSSPTLFALTGATDDRGHYRISGLVAGEYRVKATLATNSHMTFQKGRLSGLTQAGTLPLMVYAPAAFHDADAKPVKLSAGEERSDEDITYNLNGLHTVTGTVTSAEDHHPLNSGSVTLVDSADKTFRRAAGIDGEGNFSVTFVPQGTYTMTISNAADTVQVETKSGGPVTFEQNKTVRSYEKAERHVIVTDNDVTGQNFELKPAKAGNAEESGADE